MENENKETFISKYSTRIVASALILFVWFALLNIIDLTLVSEGAKIAVGQLEDSTSAYMLHRAVNYGEIFKGATSVICFITIAIIMKPVVIDFFRKSENK